MGLKYIKGYNYPITRIKSPQQLSSYASNTKFNLIHCSTNGCKKRGRTDRQTHEHSLCIRDLLTILKCFTTWKHTELNQNCFICSSSRPRPFRPLPTGLRRSVLEHRGRNSEIASVTRSSSWPPTCTCGSWVWWSQR